MSLRKYEENDVINSFTFHNRYTIFIFYKKVKLDRNSGQKRDNFFTWAPDSKVFVLFLFCFDFVLFLFCFHKKKNAFNITSKSINQKFKILSNKPSESSSLVSGS